MGRRDTARPGKPSELVGKAGHFVRERFTKRRKSANPTKTIPVSSAIMVSSEHVDKQSSARPSTQVDDHTHILRLLAEDIQGEGHYGELLALRGPGAQRALELMQELLDDGPVWRSFSVESSQENRRRIYDSMLRLSKSSQQVPSSLFVTVQHIPADMPERIGLNSDIYLALYSGTKVAVRRIRSQQWQTDRTGWEATKARLFFECLKWRQFRHPNVLPLFGIDTSFPNTPALIQPWLENGNIRQYISHLETKPEASTLIQWLIDIARGMAYLHEWHVPHGDLRGCNILISHEGVAQVADVVLFSFREEWTIGMRPRGGTERWMSPEFLESLQASYPADVYSFGSLCIEIFTGEVPFPELIDLDAVMKVQYGQIPSRPQTMPDGLWSLVTACWHLDSTQRPSMQQIVQVLSSDLTGDHSRTDIVDLAISSMRGRERFHGLVSDFSDIVNNK